jgi:6-phosphofructokinase 2
MKRIVTLTINPALDVSASLDRVEPDRKLRCGPPRYEPGGGGINVSRAIRKLGGESLAIFTAGGPTGEHLVELLTREGIEHRLIPVGELTRENMSFFEETGERQYRFVMPGPLLSGREWELLLETLAEVTPSPDFVVASGSLPPGVPDHFYRQVAEAAHRIGAKTVLDTSGNALVSAAEKGVYLLKVNIREFSHLVGRPIRDEAELEVESRKIIEGGKAEVLVISLGSAGALLAVNGEVEWIRSPTVPIRSKIGAGDSMLAGIVLALTRSLPLPDAVRFGVAAGAAAVMTPGTELSRREDAERLFELLTLDIARSVR